MNKVQQNLSLLGHFMVSQPPIRTISYSGVSIPIYLQVKYPSIVRTPVLWSKVSMESKIALQGRFLFIHTRFVLSRYYTFNYKLEILLVDDSEAVKLKNHIYKIY